MSNLTWKFNEGDGHWWDTVNNLRDDNPELIEWGFDPAEDILNICTCGSPEVIVDCMRYYLTHLRHHPHTQYVKSAEPATLLIAYMADQLGFTEHGGTIYGAWLDDAGRRWLELAGER